MAGLLDEVELDSAQWPFRGFMGLLPGQLDRLICEDHKARACRRSRYRVNEAVLQFVFAAYDRQGTRMAKAHELRQVDVASAHDEETAGF